MKGSDEMSRNSDFQELLYKGRTADGNTVDPKWSPNNIRTIIITEKRAIIEHYTVEGSANGNWLEETQLSERGANEGCILKEISRKTGILFSAVEEVILIYGKNYIEHGVQTDLEFGTDIRKSPDFLKSHGRFYAFTVIRCNSDEDVGKTVSKIKSHLMETKGTFRKHIYDKCKEMPNYFGVLDTQFSCATNQKVEDFKRGWWRAGLFDDKLDEKQRILRRRYYLLDANPLAPNEDKPDSMPIYKAFKRIGQAYLDRIEKEKADAVAKKAEERVKGKNDKKLEADRAIITKYASKYVGVADYLFAVQRKSIEFYTVMRKLRAVNDKDNSLTKEELSDITMPFMQASKAAYTMYSSDKRHTDTTKSGYKSFIQAFDGNYIATVCEGISPDLQKIAYMLSRGLRAYYVNEVGLNNDGTVACIRDIVTNKSKLRKEANESELKTFTIVENYIDRATTGTFDMKVGYDTTKPVTTDVTKFLLFVNIILEAEVLNAYAALVKTMPYWVSTPILNDVMSKTLSTTAGFSITGEDSLIRYNDRTMARLDVLIQSFKSLEDWQVIFKRLSCTKYVTGKLYVDIADYSRHILQLYDALINIVKDIMR